jgi:hypothetical protein
METSSSYFGPLILNPESLSARAVVRYSPAELPSSWERSSSSYKDSSRSRSASTTSTIHEILFGVLSMTDLGIEQRDFSSELGILEPRPVVCWESMEAKVRSMDLHVGNA